MIANLAFKKSKDAIYRIIDSKAIIMTIHDSYLHTLNEVGTFIWELLDSKVTVQDIIKRVHDTFEADTKKADRDVKSFIEDLLRRKLISPNKSK